MDVSRRADIHESGAVDFIIDLPGMMGVQIIPEGEDPVVETQHLTEKEFDKIHNNSENNIDTDIVFDHKKKRFAYKRRKKQPL